MIYPLNTVIYEKNIIDIIEIISTEDLLINLNLNSDFKIFDVSLHH